MNTKQVIGLKSVVLGALVCMVFSLATQRSAVAQATTALPISVLLGAITAFRFGSLTQET
jgi:mannose/fructose/N-acetylgalactosamine-specific phosphotransferase system component IIC